ncbi:MAG: DUF3052 domain-containing protein [Planctomycetota bacterium]
MAGYSGTPLAKKLGVKEGGRVVLLGAPGGFEETLEPLPPGVQVMRRAVGAIDVAVLFVKRGADLQKRFEKVAALLTPAGGLWIAWPKKSSGVATDLSFELVQSVGLAAGLVDNKVCAIDDVWSGLRFVRRKADR